MYYRLLIFPNKLQYKQANGLPGPSILINDLTKRKAGYATRHRSDLAVTRSQSKFADLTFGHIFPKLPNQIGDTFYKLPPMIFKRGLEHDIDMEF